MKQIEKDIDEVNTKDEREFELPKSNKKNKSKYWKKNLNYLFKISRKNGKQKS